MSQPVITPAQRVDRILEEAVGRDLTSWERHEFLRNIRNQGRLSVRQEEILAGIEERIFGGAGE